VTPNGKSALVADYDLNVVTPINLATGRTGTPISLVDPQAEPTAITITPDGESAFVVDSGAGDVATINLATMAVTGTIYIAGSAQPIAMSPDGSTAYVVMTPFNGATPDQMLVPILVGQHSAGADIDIKGTSSANFFQMAITPDGKSALMIGLASPNAVLPVTLATGASGSPIIVGHNPVAIAI